MEDVLAIDRAIVGDGLHSPADDVDGDSTSAEGRGDYIGIGWLDPIRKVVEVVMDNRLKVLDYHDCLHGFLAGRGTGTATTEVKLAQQLAYIESGKL